MSGNSIFVDTNIILYLLRGDNKLAEALLQKQIFVSCITEVELLSFKGISSAELKSIHAFLDECVIIDFTNEIKKVTIEVRKKHKLKIPDSIIIATALSLRMPLFTADGDFKKISNLDIILYNP